MPKTLRLHFQNPDEKEVDECVAELLRASPVDFSSHKGGPNPRDVLTRPEFSEVEWVVVLTFAGDAEARAFMAEPEIRNLYERYAKSPVST